jgi:polysaccharide pyruvyl transferase WcaK-like protein
MSTLPRPRQIGLFGIFGAGNLGNECTLQAMLYNLRRHAPGAEISCICSGPEETALTYAVSAVRIRQVALSPVNNRAIRWLRRILLGLPIELYRWFKAVATLKDMDMLVMTGTGMLGDFGIRPFDLHYDILRWSIAAKLCRSKLLFVSVGVGPILHPLSRRFVKAALALANYRSYRDNFSKEYLEGIGFATHGDTVYPDLAFSLPRSRIQGSNEGNGHQPVIGVGLMTYYNKQSTSEGDESVYRAYVANVAKFVTWLVRGKYPVRLLIGDVMYDKRVREDVRAALEASGVKYDGTNVIDEPASSFEEVLSQLAATDIVVASRFHNVLLALMLAKPVVAICYHEKVESLMTGVGLTEFCQSIDHIDIDRLCNQVTALSDNSGTIRLKIERTTEAYRVQLNEQYDYIFGNCVGVNGAA